METWDEEKLNEVVTQNGKKQRTTTDVGRRDGAEKCGANVQIVCKHFLQAIEDKKYGWL